MPEINNVAVLGAGALGAYYASCFARSGFTTSLVASQQRAERLLDTGVTVNGELLRLPVVTPDSSAAPADLIIVALKHHQLAEALPLLKPLVTEHTLLLSVLNGLDSETMIAELYGSEKVLLCMAVGIDAVRRDQQIIVANQGRLVFGEENNTTPSAKVGAVQNALDQAGLNWETPDDMRRALWWKFMINVGVNQASAVLRAPYAVFQRSETARQLLRRLMREVIALAQAAGVDLRDADLDEWEKVLNQLDPAAKTSMLQDVEAGRKTEVDIFAGKVVALGREYGVQTPANALIYEQLQVIEEMLAE